MRIDFLRRENAFNLQRKSAFCCWDPFERTERKKSVLLLVGRRKEVHIVHATGRSGMRRSQQVRGPWCLETRIWGREKIWSLRSFLISLVNGLSQNLPRHYQGVQWVIQSGQPVTINYIRAFYCLIQNRGGFQKDMVKIWLGLGTILHLLQSQAVPGLWRSTSSG